MASEALFQALAEAKSRPSQGFRTFQNAIGAVTAPVEGYNAGKQAQATLTEAKLKPYEIYSKLAESVGPDQASSIFGKIGMPVPDTGVNAGPTPTNDQLMKQGAYGKKQLEMRKTNQSMDIAGPRTVPALKSSIISSGQMSPEEFDKWAAVNVDPGGMIPNKNFDDLTKSLALKAQAARGNAMTGRVTNMQLNQLPSQMGPNTAAGAAYQVKVAARQGKSLIAKATSPQNLALASVDLSRAIQRAAPTSETIGAGNYAQSLPTLLSQLQQKLTADPNGPDVPKLRKQLYDTFDELDKAASPWIQNHLQTLEESGFTPNGWQGIKQREMGLNIPEIPFDAGGSVPTGVPQFASEQDVPPNLPKGTKIMIGGRSATWQ